jgi:hypothetical protein
VPDTDSTTLSTTGRNGFFPTLCESNIGLIKPADAYYTSLSPIIEYGSIAHPKHRAGGAHNQTGYDLYSWQSNHAWCFTPNTGANRLKSIDGITSPDKMIVDDAWVKFRAAGPEKIKQVLSELPKGEAILWVNPDVLKPYLR